MFVIEGYKEFIKDLKEQIRSLQGKNYDLLEEKVLEYCKKKMEDINA